MSAPQYSWITFHFARFPQPLSSLETSFDGPVAAGKWLFGPDSPLGDNGMRTRSSDVWGGAAFYSDRAAAEAVTAAPAHHLPHVAQATEAWNALLCPISHRGQVNWFGEITDAEHFAPSSQDPGGPLVVMTSAGFHPQTGEALLADMPRRLDFLANVERVREWFATIPGNLAHAVFNFGNGETDGMTFTVWRDDDTMMQTAYQPGIHRTQLDRYKTEHTADRTSFTRARLCSQSGSWSGAWTSAKLPPLQKDPTKGAPPCPKPQERRVVRADSRRPRPCPDVQLRRLPAQIRVGLCRFDLLARAANHNFRRRQNLSPCGAGGPLV